MNRLKECSVSKYREKYVVFVFKIYLKLYFLQIIQNKNEIKKLKNYIIAVLYDFYKFEMIIVLEIKRLEKNYYFIIVNDSMIFI